MLNVRLLTCAVLLAAAPAARAIDVYVAGDVAECRGAAADSAAAATARLIPPGATVFVLGDSTYPAADAATIERCYAPTWGPYRATTFAVPGNHDYVNGSAAEFLRYFGARVPHRTWFRARVGEWWVIGLDSNLTGATLARQQRWLEGELAEVAGDGRCIAALWHHALISTGLHKGDGARMKPAWQALDAAGADIVLSGHEHLYESFDPLDAEGQPQADGIREFVVGTGGARLVDFSLSNRHRDYARIHGVLELSLEADHYRYAFRGVDGTLRDQGTAACRRPARQPAAPESAGRARPAR